MEHIIHLSREHEKNIVTRTEKYWVSTESKQLLDLQMGHTAFVMGYSDSEIIKSINNNETWFVRNGFNETTNTIRYVVDKLITHSHLHALSWSASGTDAVETAIEMSRQYWQRRNPSKQKIISLASSYHGASFLTKALRGSIFVSETIVLQSKTEEDILFDVKRVFDIQSELVGAIIIETVPWVAGLVFFSSSFFKQLRQLCDAYDVLLILDDVAGCFGKQGEMFTHNSFDILPDIVAIGKSLTGGYTPLGAALCNQKVFEMQAEEWDHTYTWNPNMLGIEAASEMIKKIDGGVLARSTGIQQKINTVYDSIGIPYKSNCIVSQIPFVPNKQRFIEAGFDFNLHNNQGMVVVVPYIADDEYFDFLKTGLQYVYQ